MKKVLLLWGCMIIIVLISGFGDKRSYTMDRVDTKAYLYPDGDLYVEELMTYTFSGEFEGTTRYLDRSGGKKVEFFEAYEAPAGTDITKLTQEKTNKLTTKWDKNNNTYYIYQAAKNETKRIFYRYRIDQAAMRTTDTSKLLWRFFDNNNQDINHVTVDIFMPEKVNSSQVKAFLHDRSGGELKQSDQADVHYVNEKLSQFGDAEIAIYFPSSLIPQATISDKKISLDEENAEEKNVQNHLVKRAENGTNIDGFFMFCVLLITVGITIYVFSWWRKIKAWTSRFTFTFADLEQLDPLLMSYIYRKGMLQRKDFIVGLLSLCRRGLVSVQQTKKLDSNLRRGKEDPKTTLLFIFNGDFSQLSEIESNLIEWLFVKEGNQYEFKLDSVIIPVSGIIPYSKQASFFKRRSAQFTKQFNIWRQEISIREPFSQYVSENRLMKWVVRAIVLLYYGILIYLVNANGASLALTNCVAVLVGGVGAFTFINPRNKRWIFIFLLACLIIGGQLNHIEVIGYMLLVAYTSFLILVIPKNIITLEAMKYRYAIKRWRRALKKGPIEEIINLGNAEIVVDHVIILDVLYSIINQMKKNNKPNEASDILSAFPLLLTVDSLSALLYTQENLIFNSKGIFGGTHYSSGGGGGGTGAF